MNWSSRWYDLLSCLSASVPFRACKGLSNRGFPALPTDANRSRFSTSSSAKHGGGDLRSELDFGTRQIVSRGFLHRLYGILA